MKVQVKNIKKYFPIRKGLFRKVAHHVKAVEDVSFDLASGETLGLVGESGCGKSTLGRVILRLQDATAGKIFFGDQEITSLNRNEMAPIRRKAQMIFQDPFGSLNPRMRVSNIISEGVAIHRNVSNKELKEKRLEALDTVGLNPDSLNRFPHEFSGGQRQRIGIARALMLEPSFIIADEPVSALDVSIQAQIVNLLVSLQERLGISYVFISHDLRVVEYISSRIAVMYLGRIMEMIHAKDLRKQAAHPYTKALLEAIPIIDPKNRKTRMVLGGDVPSPISPPSGCVFHPRCPIAEDRCKKKSQAFEKLERGKR